MGILRIPEPKLRAMKTTVTQGALTANTYATVLSVTGTGFFEYLRYSPNSTRSVNFRITIDGTVVSVGANSSATAFGNNYYSVDNALMTTAFTSAGYFGGLAFKNSLLVEIQSTTGAVANDMTTDIYYQLES